MADLSSIDGHLKAYADLFIEKFDSIAGDWKEPWIAPLPFSSQNASGHLYSGVNDVNLSLTCALRGFVCPVWLTGAQCRDLGVLRLGGETGSVVYWGGTSFFDKERGVVDPQMRWAEYRRLSPREKERWSLRESPGSCTYVWNLQQTDFPDRHPDTWENLRQAFSPEQLSLESARLDGFLEKGGWYTEDGRRCPIVQTEGNAARYDRSVPYIEIPRKGLYQDERNFYSTLLHTMAHAAIVEHAVASYRGDGDPLADQARLNLSSELAAAVVCSRLGITPSLPDSSMKYLREWTQVLSDDPTVIRTVTRDARHAVERISDRIGISREAAPDICAALGEQLSQERGKREERAPKRKRTVYDSRNARTDKPRLSRRRGMNL